MDKNGSSFLVIFMLSAISFMAVSATASEKHHAYWVVFTDKDHVVFDPYEYFDQRAIDRRLRHGICLYQESNFPVRQDYIDSVSFYVYEADVVSRWMNAVHVYSRPSEVHQIASLGFVKEVIPASVRLMLASSPGQWIPGFLFGDPDTTLLKAQLKHMGVQRFHQQGFNGEGVRIALFDAGFSGVDSHEAFQHIREEGRIKATWDFHREREHVYAYSVHGTMVLSVLAGKAGDIPMGAATGADFLLARTEIFREPLVEEKYWLAAVEWADQHGADIINSSLGYVYHRYFPEQMDGQTSLVARAANMAASKGILIVNAAGNEGANEQWRVVVTPSDADSVLTVGALDYPSMVRASYSSVGPTADGRLKPNVSALGKVSAAGRRGYLTTTGTSFASPLVAGFAACLWQMYPTMSNMDIFRAIERSAHLFPYFDYGHGYGTPQSTFFLLDHSMPAAPTLDIISDTDHVSIVLRTDITAENIEYQADLTGNNYLYYHISDAGGQILAYYVIKMEDSNVIRKEKSIFEKGQQLLVHYKGYTTAMQF